MTKPTGKTLREVFAVEDEDYGLRAALLFEEVQALLAEVVRLRRLVHRACDLARDSPDAARWEWRATQADAILREMGYPNE